MSAKACFAPLPRARGCETGDSRPDSDNTGNEGVFSVDDLPEPQVIQVVLPDGEVDVRLASINIARGVLGLRQVSLDDNGDVKMGGEVTVKLASIGKVNDEDKVVFLRTGGESGRVLLELHYETVEVARNWVEALRWAMAAAALPTGAANADDGANPLVQTKEKKHAEQLRELITQQEEQVSLLEIINQKKNEQLLQMQQRLEDALSNLQESQITYAQQQRIMDEQHKSIERLKCHQQIANSAESACMLNAAATQAGATAAAQASATGPVVPAAVASNLRQGTTRPTSLRFDASTKPESASQQGSAVPSPVGAAVLRSPIVESHQSSTTPVAPAVAPPARQRTARPASIRFDAPSKPEGASQQGRATCSPVCAAVPSSANMESHQSSATPSNKNGVVGANANTTGNTGQESKENPANEDEDVEEERALLAKLAELEAEKSKFEAQLRNEQSEITAQMHDLRGMMSALGLGGGADGAAGGPSQDQSQVQAANLRREHDDIASQLLELKSMLASLGSGAGGAEDG